MKRSILLCCLAVLACTHRATAQDPGLPANTNPPSPTPKPSPSPDFYANFQSAWLVAETPKTLTWVEIFGFGDPKVSGIAHVAVFSERKHSRADATSWNHIAITTEALQRSVTGPVKKLCHYPERYEILYNGWLEEQKKGVAPVCTTSIQDYIATHKPSYTPN